MEASFVSKARTAFHSAAAKAERVFTDIKLSDLTTINRDINKQSDSESPSNDDDSKSCDNHKVKILRQRPRPIKRKQDWHERFKNIRIGKKGVEDSEKSDTPAMSFAIFDNRAYLMSLKEVPKDLIDSTSECTNGAKTDIIPPTAVLKQLAMAIEAGKKFKSMKDLLASSRDSSPVRERASLSFSTMKLLVLREREDKFMSEFGANEKVISLINSLIDTEGHSSERKTSADFETHLNVASLHKDIHGAPPESFVAKLSEAIGSLKTPRKMGLFWCRVIAELRSIWSEGHYIPSIPPDDIPDLNCCLLYQQLQVINCCISRKRRRLVATESLDSIIQQTSSNVDMLTTSHGISSANTILYARICSGELVIRLGADKIFDNLTLLETGEPVYTPVTQEGPLLTEDVIKENEEFILRTGSVGAGCSQLLSDMQAFKAANPGCILEDFVRWHSPPDWMEAETSSETRETFDSCDLLSTKGQLSRRMQKEGNLWRELWETAKPIPAVRQAPLFDEDLAVDGIFNILEDIAPSEVFEQLFISLLGSGFVTAEATLSENLSLSKLFFECKDYIVTTCQGRNWIEKVDDICQVYETVETMLINPDEAFRVTSQPEETVPAGEGRSRFKKLGFIFGGKDRNSGKPILRDRQNLEDNPARQSFPSIFSKKPPKPGNASLAEKPVISLDNDWTIV